MALIKRPVLQSVGRFCCADPIFLFGRYRLAFTSLAEILGDGRVAALQCNSDFYVAEFVKPFGLPWSQ
jgi:hypothetical protein